MKCGDCKHWVDNGTDYCSCDRDALLRERNFFCAAWERKKPFERPTTNADRIRGMSVEKLAETYAGGCPNGDRLNCGKYYLHGGRDCFNCWLDWLKAPVEEVGNG